MGVLRIVLHVIFILASIALAAIVLMKQGHTQALGAIGGVAESYWGKNKGRSMEGALVKITKYLVIAFIVIAVILNIKRF